ncbi:MAG: hypothetical protein A2551_06355 [Elusimicrobia bacterium RIFOXYD2_FULL_34_30]|nr:MAG: hypothetical protein A2551_06355 [Elusimicrobia bacterium RIFOXYD2_FULL_34_30]
MREIAKLLKALSNDTRLSIMVLLNQKELCVCQIENLLNISQVKVSRHLTVLKHAGLVTDRRAGLWIYYSAVKTKNKIEEKVFELFREIESNKSSLKISSIKLKSCKIIIKKGE